MRPECLSDDEMAFIREFAPGHRTRKVTRELNERFSASHTVHQIRYFMRKNGISNGFSFEDKNAKPIGSESVFKAGSATPEGFVKVKTAEGWRLKHHLAWERCHGRRVPERSYVLFANHDTRDFDPENLVCVPISLVGKINKMHGLYHDRESLETVIAIAKLQQAANQRNMVEGSPTNPRKSARVERVTL